MSKNPTGPSSPDLGSPDNGGSEVRQADNQHADPRSPEVLLRIARARLIEEMCYRLTDLFTLISGRVEILSDQIPSALHPGLLAIRDAAKKAAEINGRVFGVAQECRREIGA